MPKVFNELMLGGQFTPQSIVGYSMLRGTKATGHVSEDPATLDLPVFTTAVNAAGHLIVNAAV